MNELKKELLQKNEERKQAAFHGAFFYIERLHEILKALDTITVIRQTESIPLRWQENFSLLNALFKEIYPKMTTEEKNNHKEAAKIVKNYFDKAIIEYNLGKIINDLFIQLFDRWEIELRTVIREKGLDVPDKSDMTEAMNL